MDDAVLRGERVRQMRDAKRWSQTELVDAVRRAGGKTSQAQVTSMENGNVKRPKCLPELAVVFETTVDYLLGKTDDPAATASRGGQMVAPCQRVGRGRSGA